MNVKTIWKCKKKEKQFEKKIYKSSYWVFPTVEAMPVAESGLWSPQLRTSMVSSIRYTSIPLRRYIFHIVKYIVIRPNFVQPDWNFFPQPSENLAALGNLKDYIRRPTYCRGDCGVSEGT